MKEIYLFLSKFYKIYCVKDSVGLKKTHYELFWEPISIDDSICEKEDNSCMFDELYDIFVDDLDSHMQTIWLILYCDLLWQFLISYDEKQKLYLINWEDLAEFELEWEDIQEAIWYFYDLFWW